MLLKVMMAGRGAEREVAGNVEGHMLFEGHATHGSPLRYEHFPLNLGSSTLTPARIAALMSQNAISI